MDPNAWIMLFVGIAVTTGLFALGVVLYPKLKTEQQGYPFEAAIEAALLPRCNREQSAAVARLTSTHA